MSLRYSIEAQLAAAGWKLRGWVDIPADGISWWKVRVTNGGKTIEADGVTAEEAWLGALEQARSLGMLGRPGAGESGGGPSS